MDNQEMKQIQHHQQPPLSGSAAAAAATTASPPSPPSSSSSPSHEFSFTISLHPPTNNNCTKAPESNKTKQNYPPSLLDLSPADEIFFHGHLLPLHLLSHLPVSPRTSTNSIDNNNNSLPIKDFFQENKITQNSNNDDDPYFDLNHSFHHHHETNNSLSKEKPKSKSFSIFGIPKWKKGENNNQEKEKQRKLKFDVSQVLKRYLNMVRPFLTFKGRKNMEFHRQSYSFSGNLSFRRKNNSKEIRGIRRGAYSAPVSMKNSPTNSGILVAKPTGTGTNYASSSSSSSDSTMEELQAAIQAAIAHCKKSSTTSVVEEKLNS